MKLDLVKQIIMTIIWLNINKHLLDETESNIQFIASGQGNIGRSELRTILFFTGPIKWMLDEVKFNKCFIIPK